MRETARLARPEKQMQQGQRQLRMLLKFQLLDRNQSLKEDTQRKKKGQRERQETQIDFVGDQLVSGLE